MLRWSVELRSSPTICGTGTNPYISQMVNQLNRIEPLLYWLCTPSRPRGTGPNPYRFHHVLSVVLRGYRQVVGMDHDTVVSGILCKIPACNTVPIRYGGPVLEQARHVLWLLLGLAKEFNELNVLNEN